MRFTCLAAVLALSSIRTLAAAHAAKPAKLEGMEYDKARPIILGYGWKPSRGECDGPGVDKSTCARYPELGYCRYTGDGACTMRFAKDGRCLIVGTTESPPGQGGWTAIHDVTFLRGPCPKD